MLKVIKTKKNGLTLIHESYMGPMFLDVIVDDATKAFIKEKASCITYDSRNEIFYFAEPNKPRTTLARALMKAAGRKRISPHLYPRKDKFDFTMKAIERSNDF